MAHRIWETEGTMAKANRDAIVAALEHCDFNLTAASRRLRVSRTTLYRLVATYSIELPARKPAAVEAADRRSMLRAGYDASRWAAACSPQ